MSSKTDEFHQRLLRQCVHEIDTKPLLGNENEQKDSPPPMSLDSPLIVLFRIVSRIENVITFISQIRRDHSSIMHSNFMSINQL